jgi:hypothetical protein
LAVLGVATETNDTFGGFLFLPPKLPYYFCWPTNGRRKYHIIFVDPPLATETEVFCVPPPKVTKYFTSPLPPLSYTLSRSRSHVQSPPPPQASHRCLPPPQVTAANRRKPVRPTKCRPSSATGQVGPTMRRPSSTPAQVRPTVRHPLSSPGQFLGGFLLIFGGIWPPKID